MRAMAERVAGRRRHAWRLVSGLVYAAGVALAGTAAAEPLPKDACDALKSEQVALIGSGLRADMGRGTAWAKSNLGADRLKKIGRLIEVDEQILFRCAAPATEVEAAAKPAVPAKPQVAKQAKPAPGTPARTKVTGAKADDGGTAADSGGKLVPQAATAPEKPKKAAKAEAAAEKKRAATAAKAQGKTKAGDAFVPPPDAPISTLQAPAAAAQPKPQ